MPEPTTGPEGSFSKLTPYQQWIQQEGLPVIRGFYVEDMKTVEVQPWGRKDAKGTFINLEGTGGTNDAYVCEIAPGKATAPQRHFYEELIFIVSGRGATTIWLDENRKQTFEWGPGSLFSPPLNAWHQHFNGQGDKPARYLGVTTAPTIMDLIHNTDFVFNCDYVFRDRYNDEDDYFSGKGKAYPGRVWDSNFIPDVRSFRLTEWVERGAGGTNVMFELSNNTLAAHISEFPVRRYKKGHRHGPGAHVILIGGAGYSLLWPSVGGEITRVNWHDGSMFVPPDQWFHQHFNTGAEPARYLALRWGSRKFLMPSMKMSQEGIQTSVSLGGDQIEYEEEDPKIFDTFKAELAKKGLEPDMKAWLPNRS